MTSDVDVPELDADHDVAEPEPDETDASTGFDLLPEEATGRRRVLPWVAGGVVVALLAAGGGWWWLSRPTPAPPTPAPVAAPSHGLFVSISGPGDTLVDGIYFADTENPTAVFVPPSLLLDVPTKGELPLSETLPLGVDLPGAVFADATGLKVDRNWALSMDAMATLVDKVGGVTVDVDTPVDANGLNLKPGQQKLDGKAALTYATWTATGEPEPAQRKRLADVSDSLFASLPSDEAAIRTLLSEVPGKTTQNPDELASALAEVREDVDDVAFASVLLPVTGSPTAAVPNGVQVDRDGLASIAERVGDLAQFTPGQAGAVTLQNASGIKDLDTNARRRLIDLGFDYSYTGLAQPDLAVTIVSVPFGQLADGRRIAKDLSLPKAQVVEATIVPAGQRALILLGADFAAVSADTATKTPDSSPSASPSGNPAESASESQAPSSSASATN